MLFHARPFCSVESRAKTEGDATQHSSRPSCMTRYRGARQCSGEEPLQARNTLTQKPCSSGSVPYVLQPPCDHRHSTDDGNHRSRVGEKTDYEFANGDCFLVGRDGGTILINRLHAASVSRFLAVALLNDNFVESRSRTVKFSLFTTVELVDAFELCNWVIATTIKQESSSLIGQIDFTCSMRILQVATFLRMERLLTALADLIEKTVTCEHLVSAYRLAQVTDGRLAVRLWEKILTDFMELQKNRTFLLLTEEELVRIFSSPRLNVRWIYDLDILKEYRRFQFCLNMKEQLGKKDPRKRVASPVYSPSSTSPVEEYMRSGRTGAFGSHGRSRTPHSVVIAQGGWGEGGPTDQVELYDYHRESWSAPRTPGLLEEPRAYHGLLALPQGLLCMGGFNGRTYYRSTTLFDYERMEWRPICATVEARCYVSLAQLTSQTVVACGGYTGHARLKSTEVYDFERNQWQKAHPMSCIRSDSRAVSLSDEQRVYMVGGFDGRACHKTVEYYDSVRDEWFSEQATMHSKRSGVGAVSLKNRFFIAIGGFNGSNRLKSCEFFDPREGRFHEVASLNFPRSNFGNVTLEDEPWIFGGYNHEQTISSCERFDHRMNRWIVMPSMSVNRSAVACCVVEGVDFIEKILEPGENRLIGELRNQEAE